MVIHIYSLTSLLSLFLDENLRPATQICSVESTHEQTSFLNQCILQSHYLILEKLIRDVVSLFSMNLESIQDLSDPSRSDKNPIHSLFKYFLSENYLEIVMTAVNHYILQSYGVIPTSQIPSHHTTIELCLYHSKQLLLMIDRKEKRVLSTKECRMHNPNELKDISSEYDLYSLKYSAKKRRRKHQSKCPPMK
jgi:hypothetical protein